jgi:hypothetical protein
MLALAAGVALLTADASAQTPASTPQTPAATAPRPKFVAPIRGEAEIGYLKPVTKVVNNEVVTVIKIKNLSPGAIAGLKVEEFWWDKANNPVGGDMKRVQKPMLPGEVAEIELRTPKTPAMFRNNYNFSHANGTIKAKLLAKIE